MTGYVYILTNPSFKDNWVKIGKSSRPVDVRSKELDNTAVPLPFEIYATLETEKYNEAERQIHRLIDLVNPSMRIRKGREFFNVTPETALRIFKECALMLDDAKITVWANTTNAIEAGRVKLSRHEPGSQKSVRLKFSMLGIPAGTELTFVDDPTVRVRTVNDDNLVLLDDGTKATLSGAVAIIKRKLGTATTSEAYQGGNYWRYQGERLTSIRKRLGV